MLFKTIKLELYRPGREKREIIDRAIINYTKALNILLMQYKDVIVELAASGKGVSSTDLLRIPESPIMKQLNLYDAEPFKDSIKKEFASIASAFIAQSRHGKTGYPSITINEEDYNYKVNLLISDYTSGKISDTQFKRLYNGLILRLNRVHMIYFGRYSKYRDYCLLYDPLKKHFFVKLYLLNQNNKLKSATNDSNNCLRYISPGLPPVEPSKKSRRYIIFPLAFGKKQLVQLERAIVKPSILHTARLVRQKGHYYLLLNIESEEGKKIKSETTMGIARSISGLHYTIPGKIKETIKIENSANENLFLISSKIVKLAIEYRCQVVLESNGGKNDKVMNSKSLAPFSVTDYSRLAAILSYKLPGAGLPPPAIVSANGLYNICPVCGCKTYKNRISENVFACTECGFAAPLEEIGSYGLALRLDKYKNDRIPIYFEKTEDGIRYYNNNLEFDIFLKRNDLPELYYQLALLSKSTANYKSNAKKYSLVKKLRETVDISDVVRLVNKTTTTF